MIGLDCGVCLTNASISGKVSRIIKSFVDRDADGWRRSVSLHAYHIVVDHHLAMRC